MRIRSPRTTSDVGYPSSWAAIIRRFARTRPCSSLIRSSRATQAWPRLPADALVAGRPHQRTYRRRSRTAGLAERRSDGFQGKTLKPCRPGRIGRGCRYACDFCSIHARPGRARRPRNGQSAGRTCSLPTTICSTTAAAVRWTIGPLRITWSCQASLDVAADPQLVRLCLNAAAASPSWSGSSRWTKSTCV